MPKQNDLAIYKRLNAIRKSPFCRFDFDLMVNEEEKKCARKEQTTHRKAPTFQERLFKMTDASTGRPLLHFCSHNSVKTEFKDIIAAIVAYSYVDLATNVHVIA